MTQPLLCLACATALLPHLPSYTASEKPDPAPFTLSCGQHAICGRCQRKTPRLVRDCLLCLSAQDVLGPPARGSGGATAAGGLPKYERNARETQEEEGDFVIGDLEDEEEQDLDRSPPPYEGDEEAEGSSPKPRALMQDEKSRDGEGREQCSLHYIKPEDTLSGLALHYRVDGHLLARMNKLPSSTLTTTPSLLHSRAFLLLPPTVSTSTSSQPLHPPAVERQRLVLRRFQVHTRTADWALANAYVDQVFKAREKEAAFIRANQLARGQDGKVEVREGGELEEAVEAWRRDEEWEKSQTAGKGKTRMGSRLRSTGLVEREVKGWSWR